MEIGTAIRQLRKRKGYSQKQFAKKLTMSVNALCAIENNKAQPQKGTLENVCKVLDIPYTLLVFYSLDYKDIPEPKRELFRLLSVPLKQLIEEIL